MSDKSPDAYLAGLRMLARREVSEARLRERLERRGFASTDIDDAAERLRETGALDDRRTARALASHAAHIKLRGRFRAIRELEAQGIRRPLAHEVVDEVYGELDQQGLMERALGKRLTGQIETPADLRRLYQYLVRQGFGSAAARSAVLARATPSATRRGE